MSDLTDQLLDEEEGNSAVAYVDSRGYTSIGRGVCIDRHVAGAGLPAAALEVANAQKLTEALARSAVIPGYASCNDVRKAVIDSMCYQLGTLAGWTRFKSAVALDDYDEAANQMLYEADGVTESDWQRETPKRCKRAAAMMRSGEWINQSITDGDD